MKKEHELLEAARLGDIQVVARLFTTNKSNPWSLASLGLKARVNVNCTDLSGYTPLHHASLNGHSELVRMLLQNSASTNISDNKGNFPLHLAAWSGFCNIVHILLSHGPSIARINEKNNDHETALHCAAQHGHLQAVEALVKAGANSSIRNVRGESPLDLASQYGRLDVVRSLLFHEPSLLQLLPETFSPLHVASRNGHKEIVELLIAHGADVNSNSENGTPLHEAALFGKLDVVKLLLNRGANPHAVDAQGRSPLELVRHLDTKISRDIYKLLSDRLQDSEDYVPLSPEEKLARHEHSLSSYTPIITLHGEGNGSKMSDSSIKDNVSKLSTSHSQSSTTGSAHRSNTFKGLSRGWARMSARKIGFRRTASVRNSKSLPKLPSSPTSASPVLHFRQFHPSSNQFPVAGPSKETSNSLSILSLPAAVSSQSATNEQDRRMTSCTLRSDDDCVFYSSNLKDSSTSSNRKQTEKIHKEVAPLSKPLLVDPTSIRRPDRQAQSRTPEAANSSSLSSEVSAKKPVKPVRQKLSTISSPPPLPPKPNHARPPSPSCPPPSDDFFDFSDSDIDETAETNPVFVKDDGVLREKFKNNKIGDVAPPFSPPSPHRAMIQVSETLQRFIPHDQDDPPTMSNIDCCPSWDGQVIDSSISEALVETCHSSSCFVKSRVREARIRSTASTDVSTPLEPSSVSRNSLLHPVLSSEVIPLHNPPAINLTDGISFPTQLISSLGDEAGTDSAATSEWSDALSDRTEDLALPRKLKKFRGLTRGASLGTTEFMSPSPLVKNINDEELSSSDEMKNSSEKQVASFIHPSLVADNDLEKSSEVMSPSSCLPDFDTIKDTVAAVRDLSFRRKKRTSRFSPPNALALVQGSIPKEDSDDWSRIATAMSSVSTEMNQGDVYASQFQETFWKIMTGSSFPQSISSWLEGLALIHYQGVFIKYGFDNIKFLTRGIPDDEDLLHMSVSDSSHRKAILNSIENFPPLSLPHHPTSLVDYLAGLGLAQHKLLLSSAGCCTLDQLVAMSSDRIHKIILKRGHAKRIIATRPLLQSSTTSQITEPNLAAAEQVPRLDGSIVESNLTAQGSRAELHGREASEDRASRSSGSADTDHRTSSVRGRERKKISSMNSNEDFSVPTRDRALQLSSSVEGISLRPPNEATDEVKVSAWRHPQEALIQSSCNFQAYYLGSMLIEELKGVESTQEACSKMRKSTDAMKKIPCITLSINYAGVKFIDFKSKHEIAEHEIQNISFASQDATDLATFAYITCDIKTGRHYCHVFRVTTMDKAYEIILTVGQAFEVAYQLIMKEKELKHSDTI